MPEMIKRYRNCELWASITTQDNGGAIPYFTITDVNVDWHEITSEYQWQPALWLSAGNIQLCRERIANVGHGQIMRQMLWSSP